MFSLPIIRYGCRILKKKQHHVLCKGNTTRKGVPSASYFQPCFTPVLSSTISSKRFTVPLKSSSLLSSKNAVLRCLRLLFVLLVAANNVRKRFFIAHVHAFFLELLVAALGAHLGRSRQEKSSPVRSAKSSCRCPAVHDNVVLLRHIHLRGEKKLTHRRYGSTRRGRHRDLRRADKADTSSPFKMTCCTPSSYFRST